MIRTHVEHSMDVVESEIESGELRRESSSDGREVNGVPLVDGSETVCRCLFRSATDPKRDIEIDDSQAYCQREQLFMGVM